MPGCLALVADSSYNFLPMCFNVHMLLLSLNVVFSRYMCRLSDADLRLAGNRSMTDLMWAAVKEPLDTHFTFDREGLALAYKYFTCSTLTIRLTGITQINVSGLLLLFYIV